MVEALALSINDGTIRKQGRVTATAGVEDSCLAADVQIALVLAGKAGVRKVLGSGARSHRDISRCLAQSATKLAIRRCNRLAEIWRPRTAKKCTANRGGDLGQR